MTGKRPISNTLPSFSTDWETNGVLMKKATGDKLQNDQDKLIKNSFTHIFIIYLKDCVCSAKSFLISCYFVL